jgi:fumarate hydratase, class I
MAPALLVSLIELIVRTSTDLPPEVRAALRHAIAEEPPGTRSAQALTIIAQNIDLAANGEGANSHYPEKPTL